MLGSAASRGAKVDEVVARIGDVGEETGDEVEGIEGLEGLVVVADPGWCPEVAVRRTDGAIVGTALKRDGMADNPMDGNRARALVAARDRPLRAGS